MWSMILNFDGCGMIRNRSKELALYGIGKHHSQWSLRPLL